MAENPLKCVRKLVKYIVGGTESKREVHVHKILSLPINPQEIIIIIIIITLVSNNTSQAQVLY